MGLLGLAEQLGNVSPACKLFGYSRDTFYRYKELYETGGEATLQEVSRKSLITRTVSKAELEAQAIQMASDVFGCVTT